MGTARIQGWPTSNMQLSDRIGGWACRLDSNITMDDNQTTNPRRFGFNSVLDCFFKPEAKKQSSYPVEENQFQMSNMHFFFSRRKVLFQTLQ